MQASNPPVVCNNLKLKIVEQLNLNTMLERNESSVELQDAKNKLNDTYSKCSPNDDSMKDLLDKLMEEQFD